MITQIRNRYFVLSDILLLPIAAYVSFVLRLDKINIDPFWGSCLTFTLAAVGFTLLFMHFTGLYARYWPYASIEEMWRLLGVMLAVTVSSTVVTFSLGVGLGLFPFPRSVPVIFLFLGTTAVVLPRFGVRLIAHAERRRRRKLRAKPVLIMGAGDAGEKISRELLDSGQTERLLVGFVDDNEYKKNMRIHGVPVLGTRHDIPQLVDQHAIQQVIIAMPTAPGSIIREVVRICEEVDVVTQTVPSLYGLIDGSVNVQQLRNVDIEDLLRREPIRTDFSAVSALLTGRKVLVTGGGGSIGSELCRQIVRCKPAELILLGHGENSIFNIFHELRQLDPTITLSPVIADVRFPDRIMAIFSKYQPDIVFHAAAHKHVPLMEANPGEAVTNNVFGTHNLLAAAQATDVQQFVMISTDKAVNPTNVMGASKRSAELLVHQAAERTGRPYVAVRFGNVLGSRGSVVLTFKRQIAAGGPITITHPDIERFFMTIPEAVQLVLQAAVLGTGGEVFVLDMGEPVKIVDLAQDLIRLSGLHPGEDIDIEYIGLRPGEKLYEELFIKGETYRRTTHEKIYIAENASSLIPSNLEGKVATLFAVAKENDPRVIRSHLQALVPEYRLESTVPAPSTEKSRRPQTTTVSLSEAKPTTGLSA